ncbi:MAG: aspartyl/asparaginyl beta-hydroxylase domain-containing protein [Pseudomonadota bacterium]
MQHFAQIASGHDVSGILEEISQHAAAWTEQTGRQARARVQAETTSIPLRGLRRSRIMGRRRRDVHESRPTTLSRDFARTSATLHDFAEQLDGTLGRAKLALLPAGARVMPHSDRGAYYRIRNRYHLVLQSTGGSLLEAGGERIRMQASELWWFDNKAIHSARNDSEHPRIHLIFDLLPNGRNGSAAGRKAGNEDTGKNPGRMLTAAKARQTHSARENIRIAASLYLAVCENPRAWQRILQENGLEDMASKRPLHVLAALLWPELSGKRRRRRESAVAWVLAQLDLGRIELEDCASAIAQAGGIVEIDRAWRFDREATLYGASA